jgi:hypothetical protein
LVSSRSFVLALAALVFASFCGGAASADEGMWTFDNFPAAKVAKAYGFRPSSAFLQHVQRSTLRIAGGCSASFVSPEGLVLTNHHCVVGCAEQLSTPQENLVDNGFYAKRGEDERACPAFELDQLVRIDDITRTIRAATAGKTGAAANAALRGAEARAQQSCGGDRAVRCDVVSLYHGGVYDLYRYKRYTDVRLAFVPEFAVAQFGGDPDNFNFPRFDYDMSLVRAYENGKPAATPDYLHWSANGSKAGELVFTAGNPGSTARQLTSAQLAYLRDYDLPVQRAQSAELRGVLEEYSREGPAQQREAHEPLFYLENGYKVATGQRLALVDPAFFGTKLAQERQLRAQVAARPALRADASAWDEIARIQAARLELAPRQSVTRSRAFRRGLLADALTLVRAAQERAKPNGSRLPEFTDQALVAVAAEIAAPGPVYPELERRMLAFSFAKIRETLGTDDPLVVKMLGRETPDQLAQRLVSGTKLADPAVRKALYDGGSAAVAASNDPMIAYARAIDPDLRAIRKAQEDRIDAPSRAAAERIAQARFAVYGTSVDPDATFSPRVSYGTVKSFANASGATVAPYTTIGGLFNRATGADPYVLPPSWLAAKAALDPSTPMNLSTTNDIIGGNSGSPLVNARAEVVGLIFDGNIYSLGGDYGYDPVRNRAVSLDSRALLAALGTVYHADRLVTEITSAR